MYTAHPHHYIVDPAQCQEFYTAHPHNLILDYWLSLGIMGLLVLVWVLWRYFRVALVTVRRVGVEATPDPTARALTIGLLAGMVDFLVHGMVDNSYFLMDLAMIFWLSCGLLQLAGAGPEQRMAQAQQARKGAGSPR
jgi:O-antigen ligase